MSPLTRLIVAVIVAVALWLIFDKLYKGPEWLKYVIGVIAGAIVLIFAVQLLMSFAHM